MRLRPRGSDPTTSAISPGAFLAVDVEQLPARQPPLRSAFGGKNGGFVLGPHLQPSFAHGPAPSFSLRKKKICERLECQSQQQPINWQ